MKPPAVVRSGRLSLGAMARDIGVSASALRPFLDEVVPDEHGYYGPADLATLLRNHPELLPE